MIRTSWQAARAEELDTLDARIAEFPDRMADNLKSYSRTLRHSVEDLWGPNADAMREWVAAEIAAYAKELDRVLVMPAVKS